MTVRCDREPQSAVRALTVGLTVSYNHPPTHPPMLQLKNVLPDGLLSKVTENGQNFSVGQRQLICMARAMLQKNRILVLDEATANIDSETDHLIQTIIRSKFTDWTVLTIAHRLNTVIDSDRIAVMDAGRVVDYDTPEVLLKKDGGLLAELAAYSKSKEV